MDQRIAGAFTPAAPWCRRHFYIDQLPAPFQAGRQDYLHAQAGSIVALRQRALKLLYQRVYDTEANATAARNLADASIGDD
jgi:hypothetical protein